MNIFKKRRQLKQDIKAYAFLENGKPDYNYYVMSKAEKITYSTFGVFLFALIGFTFYHNIIFALIVSLIGLLFPDYMYSRLVERRKRNLDVQFKDLLYFVSSSLSAGKSVEMAFNESIADLRFQYPDEDTDIIREVEYIIRGLSVNDTIEDILLDFADRSHSEDIKNFADVFISCKRTGGNLIEVVRIASNVIADKITIKREIGVSLSEKKFEQKGMCGLMLLLILGLTYMSGDYMDPMFNSISGRIAMTFALLLLLGSYFLGEKIINIEV